ncbi:MAG: M56 family metallopeptidase [Bryobacteraceae bacterium]
MTILLESAIRVTLIAAIIALVLFAMRIKTSAVLHAVWASVVVVMMLLPAWVAWGPKASLPVLPPDRTPVVTFLPPPSPAGRVSTILARPISSPDPSPARKGGGYVAIYLLGVGVFLLRLAIGTVRANRLTSASCVVPVTVGLLHPRIILPESAREWPQAQMNAVLAHEGEHLRRRDPLFQWIALLNRAIFWFHPLAWWLERKLSGLAEETCDGAVLAKGHDPRDYSAYLLDLARTVKGAGLRVGMAMPGASLPYRIRRMLSGIPTHKISRPRMACTVAICSGAAAILVAGTLVHAQSKPQPGVQFEVAAIRPTNLNAGGDGKTKGKDGGGPRSGLDHLRFNYSDSLRGLIIRAYSVKGCPPIADCTRILGGPAWLKKDRFDIQAKMPDGSSEYTFQQFMDGQASQLQLMLQALLAQRFNLRLHREQRQLPVFVMTVTKLGTRLKKAAEPEIISLPDGSSIKNRSLVWTPTLEPNGERSERTVQMIVRDRTLQEVGDTLSMFVGRPVLDRTGLKGEFDFTLEYDKDPDANTPSGALGGPAMFTAFREQLGFKFEATKGPVDVLVIDHAEKPSAN